MKKSFDLLDPIATILKRYCVLIILLILMLIIHHYVFIYADDLYYCRDASAGLKNLPHFIYGVLNENGRIWVHLLLLGIVKYNAYLFRIVNPIVIMLTALMVARISVGSENDNKKFLVATACASMFFIVLPIEISDTTIYYAACSLNYLIPTAVSIIYGYLFYNDYSRSSENYKTKWYIILLAFFAGSSTQQAGMIGIGFTVLITLYFIFYKKKKFEKAFIPYYAAVIFGYGFVTYGSVKRALFEKSTGKGMDIPITLDTMLKSNIFGIPALCFVLILCLCCFYWLYHYSYEDIKNTSKTMISFNKLLAAILAMGTMGYIFFLIYKQYEVVIFSGANANIIIRLCYLAFTLVYLLSILYVSILILAKEKYPFLFFCCINAFGAQLMLIVVDPRFAGDYRIVFPSFLLMSIFITYSFVKFYNKKIFLTFAMLAIALGIMNKPLVLLTLVFIAVFVLCRNFSFENLLLNIAVIIGFSYLALVIFHSNYEGYKASAQAQIFNMNAIEQFHKNKDSGVLKLKKTPPTKYGYNVDNWNNMPYFMKQCYKIKENTVIEYYK